MKAVSGKEFCKALERAGWRRTRIRGNHHRYEKPGSAPVSVPVHGNRTLKRGTQQGLMKATGMTEADL